MAKTQLQLSAEERGLIMTEQLCPSSNASIARALGRALSTSSGEFRRCGAGGQYAAAASGVAYPSRRRARGHLRELQQSLEKISNASKTRVVLDC